MKKILLAAPGTGKTTKVKKDFLKGVQDFGNVLVLSFTNATINDLIKSFADSNIPIDEKNCMTLHSYALRINHRRDMHVLNTYEEKVVATLSKSLEVHFRLFCEMLDCITYDQMITDFLDFAKANPVYVKEKVDSIELLIVDEFQDFNDAEQKLIHLIAEHSKDTLILGDDDQCIYDFKDATSEGIISLYNDPAVFNIEHENICYRCPDTVVEKAKNLIANNKQRVAKDWHPNGIEGRIHFEQKRTMAETIEWVIQAVSRIRESRPDASILVLSPVRFAVETLPDALEKAVMPHLDFFGDTIDLEAYQKIWKLRLVYTKYKLLNLILAVCLSDLSDYKKKKFRKLLKKHLHKTLTFAALESAITEFLDEKLRAYLKEKPDFDALLEQEPWSSLREMISKIDAPTPEGKLERVDRYINPPVVFDPKVVNIMSIHKSKGLQASHVFILGLVDGILPRKTDGVASMEMQRRLLFVAMTRAQRCLYLLSTIRWDAKHVHQLGREKFSVIRIGGRQYNARTSPFVNELKL